MAQVTFDAGYSGDVSNTSWAKNPHRPLRPYTQVYIYISTGWRWNIPVPYAILRFATRERSRSWLPSRHFERRASFLHGYIYISIIPWIPHLLCANRCVSVIYNQKDEEQKPPKDCKSTSGLCGGHSAYFSRNDILHKPGLYEVSVLHNPSRLCSNLVDFVLLRAWGTGNVRCWICSGSSGKQN